MFPKNCLPRRCRVFFSSPSWKTRSNTGLPKASLGGRVRIGAFRSDQVLTLNVYNDGPTLAPNHEMSSVGTGISNIQTRLRGLYGNAFSLTMRNEGSHGVEVSISLPFREA